MKKITSNSINQFKKYLILEEKSNLTVEKYVRDITKFMNWCYDKDITKEVVLEYKQMLIKNYLPASVNSILSSINAFFAFKHRHDLKVKALKIQKQIFTPQNRELNKSEYYKLLEIAQSKKNQKLYYLIQTICSTGIRISELKYITVEAVKNEKINIKSKGKIRLVFIPKRLCKILNKYISQNKIKSGPVFISRNGNPLDRSNVWKALKNLCKNTNLSQEKIFPHNLRHLFAKTYYSAQKDIVRLADILGHSNINTTRIYTMESGDIHYKQIQKLGLLRF